MRGLGRDAVEVLGQGAQAFERDLVIGEGLPPPGTGCGVERGGPGVVECDALAGAVDQPAEVAVPHGHGGHGGAGGVGRQVAISLVSEKEKSPVATVVQLGQVDRPAHGGAKLVAHQVRRLVVEVLAAACDPEGIVANGFEQPAVKVVGAALGGDDGGGRAVHLGRGVVGLHQELLDGVNARRASGELAGVAVGEHGAVLQELHGGGAQPVNARAGGSTFETRCGELHQRLDETPVQRQLLDARALHHVSQRGGGRGDQRRHVTGHGDFGHYRADLKHRVHHRGLADLQHQFALPFLHPGGFHRNLVAARLQRREQVEADLVGLGLLLAAGLRLQYGDFRVGHHGAGGIFDRALDVSGAGLPQQHRRGQQAQQRQTQNA